MRLNPTDHLKERFLDSKIHLILIAISAVCLIPYIYFHLDKIHFLSADEPFNGSKSTVTALSKETSTQSEVVGNVVSKALAFQALLNPTQQTTLEQSYTTTLARKWSNLPCGASCRNGIEFGVLNSDQLAAALDVIKAATGTNPNNGFDEFLQIRLAEANLHANGGGSGYDTTLRWIAFLNPPSETGAWMLQFGGHHYAANIAYNNGHVIGATPYFMGLEPLSFTLNNKTYAPLNDEHSALTQMLASLTAPQLATAYLNTTFSDCTMIPGESNGGTGTFPTKVGVVCSLLTADQKNLVLSAIRNYVEDMDSVTAASIMSVYASEIDQTYIAYTGNGTSRDTSSFLNASSNYVRIDGPTVWVEFVCQNGIVYRTQIHYHTVWRDHAHDYGVDLTGDPIDINSTTAVVKSEDNNAFNIYLESGNQLLISLKTAVQDAKITIVHAGTGKTYNMVAHTSGKNFQFDVSHFSSGLYVVEIESGTSIMTGKFNKI